MPRRPLTPPPPCPISACGAYLHKHDMIGRTKRYRCPKCHGLVRAGRSAEWAALSAEVMRGSRLSTMASNLFTDEKSARLMISAWARRAEARHGRAPPGTGSGWWWVSTAAGLVAIGLARARSPRVVGWESGPNPTVDCLAHPCLEDSGKWAQRLVSCSEETEEVRDRLWIAMAKTNGWRLD